jgi:soluble lytic murein transglycosylase-like protein
MIAEHPQPVPCASVSCEERVARKQCSNHRPVPCIRRASLHWRVSFTMLHRKAWCESRYVATAANPSGAIGLLQFMPSTWGTTPYAGHSPWYAKWSALAGAWMHRVGRGGEWTCQ